MNAYIHKTVTTDGKKYYSEFDSRSTTPIRRWVERPDGTIEYEEKDGQGRGTTAPEGLYPPEKS